MQRKLGCEGGVGNKKGHVISDDEHDDKTFMTLAGCLKVKNNFLKISIIYGTPLF